MQQWQQKVCIHIAWTPFFGVRMCFGGPIQDFKNEKLCLLMILSANIQTWPLLFGQETLFSILNFCYFASFLVHS